MLKLNHAVMGGGGLTANLGSQAILFKYGLQLSEEMRPTEEHLLYLYYISVFIFIFILYYIFSIYIIFLKGAA